MVAYIWKLGILHREWNKPSKKKKDKKKKWENFPPVDLGFFFKDDIYIHKKKMPGEAGFFFIVFMVEKDKGWLTVFEGF